MNMSSDVKIVGVEYIEVPGKRPRPIGRNATNDVEGDAILERVVRLHTNSGMISTAHGQPSRKQAEMIVGHRVCDLFSIEKGTADAWLAFDLTLWDLAGRILGQPVYQLLGNRGCHPVPIYDGLIYIDELDPRSGTDLGVAPMVRHALDDYKRGFRAFKIKVGRGYRWMEHDLGLARDIEVVRSVRNALGPDVRLMIDANNGYTPDDARYVLMETAECGVTWIEEPFPEDMDEDLALVDFIREQGLKTLVADGETAFQDSEQVGETLDIVRAGGIQVLQFKLRRHGLTRWRRYLPVVAESGTQIAPHSYGAPSYVRISAHLGRGCPHYLAGEADIADTPGMDMTSYKMNDGCMVIEDNPGFGFEPSHDLVNRIIESGRGWRVGDVIDRPTDTRGGAG